MYTVFLQIALLLWCYASLWFFIALYKKRNDVADIAWGLGYILVCVFLFFIKPHSSISLLLYGLVTLWGVRLSAYIYFRNKGKQEDFRYQQWRKEWAETFYWRSYLQVFLLQAFFLLVIISPVIFAAASPSQNFSWVTAVGVFLWFVGFFFQAVGDHQLSIFSKYRKSKTEILQTGLWRYSRHPNYFGEILMWWSVFLIVVPFSQSFYFIISPLTITILLVFVSGIPLLEKKYAGNAAFDDYKRRTSALFPLPVKK